MKIWCDGLRIFSYLSARRQMIGVFGFTSKKCPCVAPGEKDLNISVNHPRWHFFPLPWSTKVVTFFFSSKEPSPRSCEVNKRSMGCVYFFFFENMTNPRTEIDKMHHKTSINVWIWVLTAEKISRCPGRPNRFLAILWYSSSRRTSHRDLARP
jgi:hypothetical protein